MAKLNFANIFLLVLLVSVVWMTSEVVDGSEMCKASWCDKDCEIGFKSCIQECERQFGPSAYGHCKDSSLCECIYPCHTY